MPEKTDILILNADELVTVAGASRKPKRGDALCDLKIIKNGSVAIGSGKILAVGDTKILEKQFKDAKDVIDAKGKTVLPGFIDPHTHLVFAGSRHQEYSRKIAGLTYQEITAQGTGAGILYTVKKTRQASKSELLKKALKDLDIMLSYGTTTVEIKSGYGLDAENELKILEVVRELIQKHLIKIIPTFLAHAFPGDCDKNDKAQRFAYIASLKNILDTIKERKLAEYCDVFCDPLAFNLDETREILAIAEKFGFKLKLHAEQTSYLGGAELAAESKATSADHLDYISHKGIRDMATAGVIGVLLPTATFHLMEMIPNARKEGKISKSFLPDSIRKMIIGGIPLALATDYNPGSSPTLSMQMVMQCAARLYRMSPAQIINAATINAAHALNRADEIGSLEAGKKADIIICDCPSHEILIDSFGVNLVEKVIKNGQIVVPKIL